MHIAFEGYWIPPRRDAPSAFERVVNPAAELFGCGSLLDLHSIDAFRSQETQVPPRLLVMRGARTVGAGRLSANHRKAG